MATAADDEGEGEGGGEGTTAGAQSVRRALAVLRVLATGQERGVRLTDVVSHTGLNRPTVHRLLRVLVEEGAVEQDLATRRYLVGGEVSLLGLARASRFPIQAIAEPHLRHLSESLGDTAFLTIRNGTDSVCIDRRPGSFPVKVLSIEIGARRPLGVGVSGLVLLASLPADEAADVVRRNARRLEALHVDPAELLERAVRTRAQGYAYAPIGVVPGSRAVAVPICLADGRTVAGLAIATITERLPDARVQGVVEQMRARARLIGAQAAELARRKSARRG
ncbi:IclR family transcriptional regulator [Variovorax sp. J22G73]|jgi:DNA-binding IclR family transcriptional regulator|uniref:IclR family transcriptional regulator n=1 Tax=unclassified Variovorax TaxID=663243 RepID=UPI002574E35A|nr:MULTISPECIES: IclR family transcriptional regulator [unclassified Variovorax]MDM0005313.1 IclR family transcriptional regulator [Variovorax sp. J22R203]MDM0098729.1 IclR family transcriptional regulator [Variovorax sp. J22G73]